MAKYKEAPNELNDNQKAFCNGYIFDWNGTRAYMAAYPNSSEAAAGVSAHELLKNPKIKAYIEDIQKDLEKIAGISRLKVIGEHQKLAFSSIAHLHNTWIERKEFEKLTDDQKTSIAEIQTQTRTEMKFNPESEEQEPVQVDFVKIKLYDKQKSLDSISRMLGYDAAQKIAITDETVKSFKIVSASTGKGSISK